MSELNEKLKNEFFNACRSIRPKEAREALEKGLDPNAQIRGRSLLSYAAAEYGFSEVVELLLKKGADVNARDEGGQTTLMWATERGYIDSMELLLAAKGVDVNAKDKNGRTALMRVGQTGYNDSVVKSTQLLLDRGAKVLDTDNNGMNPLMWAAEGNSNTREGVLSAVKLFLKKGTDINAKDKNGRTVLMHAAGGHNFGEIVNFLLEKGADVNAKDHNGMNMLMHAVARWAKEDVIDTFLAKGIGINVKDKNGMTALMHAAGGSYYDKIENFLLEKGADINAKDNNGMTVLMHAVQDCAKTAASGEYKIGDLLAKGMDINAKDNNGMTVLMHAALKGDYRAVERLLNRGANPYDENNAGENAFHLMEKIEKKERQNYVYVKSILKAYEEKARQEAWHQQQIEERRKKTSTPPVKSQLEQPTAELNTALLQACKDGKEEEAIRLLNAKANPNARGEGNSTPLMWAAYIGQIEVVKLLLEKKADVHAKDNEGKTALNFAEDFAKETGDTAIQKLLEKASKPAPVPNQNAPTRPLIPSTPVPANPADKTTALFQALNAKQEEEAIRLLNAGADPNAKNKLSLTPLMYASVAGQTKAVATLLEKGANPNIQEPKGGLTALMLAASKGHPEVVKLLVKGGADVHARNADGATVFSIAIKSGNRSVIDALMEEVKEQRRQGKPRSEALGGFPSLASVGFGEAAVEAQQALGGEERARGNVVELRRKTPTFAAEDAMNAYLSPEGGKEPVKQAA